MADRAEDYLALQTRRLFAGADPRGLQSAISDVTANRHRMLLDGSTTSLSGEVHGVQLGRIGLVSIRYSLPLAINSRATGRRVLLVIPRAPMQVHSGRRQWFSDAPFVMGTEHATRVVPTPGRGALVAAMDAEEVEQAIERATGRRFNSPLRLTSDTHPLLLAAPSAVRSASWEVCRCIEQADASVADEVLAHHLVSAVAIGVSPFVQEILTAPGTPGRGYLEAATAFIAEHLAEDLSVGRVAERCGISQRQLHAAFREHLSITPAQYVRERRLQAARRLLTDRTFAGTGTVGAALTRVGGTHPGRFAKAYADRYAETPSQTLGRTRSEALSSVPRDSPADQRRAT